MPDTPDTKQAATCPSCGSKSPSIWGGDLAGWRGPCRDPWHPGSSAHPVSAEGEKRVAEESERPEPGARCGVCGELAERTVQVERPTRYRVHRCSEHWTAAPYRAEARAAEAEAEIENYKAYGDEAWAWLEEALDALGVETVFDIPKHPQDEG